MGGDILDQDVTASGGRRGEARSAPIRYVVEAKWEISRELEMRPVTVSRTQRKSAGSAESAERVAGVESGRV